MKTEAANAFADHILAEAKRLNDTAIMYAVSYAKSDSPEDRTLYVRYSFAAEEVRKLHSLACQTLHAIESLITDDLEASKEKQP